MAFAAEESPSKSEVDGVYYLAKCVLKGSVVLQSVFGHFRSPFSSDVVFGKETSIELAVIGEDGIVQSVCEQTVFGTIKDLAVLRWNEKFRAPIPQTQGKDLLVVLSDSGKLSFLTFCSEMHRFFPVTHIHLSEPGNSRHQLGRMLAVDYDGSFVAVSAYEDRLALFSLSPLAGSNIIDKKMFHPPENEGDRSTGWESRRPSISGTIWSMCFISKDVNQLSSESHNIVLAMILHRKGAVLNELVLLGCDTVNQIIYIISQCTEPGPLALTLVEVPCVYGFAFLFRVGDVLLMDLRDPHYPCCVYRTSLDLPTSVEEGSSVEESSRGIDVDDEGIFNVAASALLELRASGMYMNGSDPMSIDSDSGKINSVSKLVCSWSWEPNDSTSSKMILCLDTGELYVIDICSDLNGIRVNLSDCLYRCLPCKTLLWSKGGFIAALVEMGDGLILRLENGRLVYRSPIQNIAPILDVSVVDYHDEKQDQMFACCGMGPEGSLRIIRSGISVEKLLSTSPIYQGISGAWTIRIKESDFFHSFLVLSFVEETRVLSVGVSFIDVTDAVGFQPDVCTLACGLLADRLLVQIHRDAVRLCLPTTSAHPEGIPLSTPVTTSWYPDNVTISLGAVGQHLVILATSNPCFLFILGTKSLSAYHYEIYELYRVKLQHEVSCISIPLKVLNSSKHNLVDDQTRITSTVEISKTFVIGTHKPSVEVLTFLPEEGLRILAVGNISLTNTLGTPISGCVPQDVRLVFVDRLYIVSGLRNGMLLRFEWLGFSSPTRAELFSQGSSSDPCFGKLFSSSNMKNPSSSGLQFGGANMTNKAENPLPIQVQLIAIRRIGISPVFLVPLHDSLSADIIALSDRPWLLQTARHSLAYTSISFQPATHVTPVCCADCPKGILFVAENSLHLVEMVHNKRLDVQKFHLGSTPRKILYHSESETLLVMKTEMNTDPPSSDICRIDPLSGASYLMHKFVAGEVAKCMQLIKVGNEQLLVVGTCQSHGCVIMPSGEAESTRGRLLVFSVEHMQNSDSGSLTYCSKPNSSSPFREIVGYATEQLSSSSLCSSPDDGNCDGVKLEENGTWQLREVFAGSLSGAVLTICPYLDHYFLASAGNILYVCGFQSENPLRLRRFTSTRTRFTITSLTALFTRIVVGDCRDGILFYSYQEDLKKLEQLYSDPVQRLVADCALINLDTAVVSDRRGNISVLSRGANHLEDNASPECNLIINCSYYIGETVMSIRKGSFSYKLPVDDVLKGYIGAKTNLDSARSSIVATTLLGSVFIFIPLSREEHELLEPVQSRLMVHPLTAPVLGNDHREFRGRGSLAGVPRVLDGDMLAQFLELTSIQQEAVLASGMSPMASSSLDPSQSATPVDQVVRLLERIHYALN